MKRIILVIFGLVFIISLVFADVKLYHYTDKVTGEERGICYSDKDGKPQNNPDWNCEEIQEKDKEHYIKLQREQIDKKPKPKTPLELLEERVSALEKK